MKRRLFLASPLALAAPAVAPAAISAPAYGIDALMLDQYESYRFRDWKGADLGYFENGEIVWISDHRTWTVG
jgi:hypothetical protein